MIITWKVYTMMMTVMVIFVNADDLLTPGSLHWLLQAPTKKAGVRRHYHIVLVSILRKSQVQCLASSYHRMNISYRPGCLCPSLRAPSCSVAEMELGIVIRVWRTLIVKMVFWWIWTLRQLDLMYLMAALSYYFYGEDLMMMMENRCW